MLIIQYKYEFGDTESGEFNFQSLVKYASSVSLLNKNSDCYISDICRSGLLKLECFI